MNVEANPDLAQSFLYLRPEMATLNMAVGKPDEFVTIQIMGEDSSSTVNPGFEDYLHKSRPGLRATKNYTVPSISIKEICERYFYRRPIFISLDIEGNEGVGLENNDWNNPKCRPDVWMVEVFDKKVDPDGKRYNASLPEDILSQNGYKPLPGNFPHEIVYVEEKVFDKYQ